jgi:hypothetical protein
MTPRPSRYVRVYLNDHLAGATVGVGVARRLRDSNRGDPEMAEPLSRICAEIEADQETLEAVMKRLGVRRGRIKPALAAAGERLGRLKPNGQLRGYSPLSRLIELEFLLIGIAGKMQLWKALERALGEALPEFDFPRLAERAAEQRRTVDELHGSAATRALRQTLPPRERTSDESSHLPRQT